MKIKVNKKLVERFLEIAEEYGEYIFGDYEYVKNQLETCLNIQGYWSGCSYRFYYDSDTKDFYVESRF